MYATTIKCDIAIDSKKDTTSEMRQTSPQWDAVFINVIWYSIYKTADGRNYQAATNWLCPWDLQQITVPFSQLITFIESIKHQPAVEHRHALTKTHHIDKCAMPIINTPHSMLAYNEWKIHKLQMQFTAKISLVSSLVISSTTTSLLHHSVITMGIESGPECQLASANDHFHEHFIYHQYNNTVN